MHAEIVKDVKVDILKDFLGKTDKQVTISSNFQQSRYAKRMKLLAKGVLPKEDRVVKKVYSRRDEHLQYVEQQIEHFKSTKLKRRIQHVD